MKRKQFSEEQIVGILKMAESGAVVTELCRKHEMSSDLLRVEGEVRQAGGVRREASAVEHLQATLWMTERRACMVFGADRTSIRYRSCQRDDGDLRAQLCELAQQRWWFGYRRLQILLRRHGITINRKKTQRL
ncbi:hypothetical protein ASE90_16700 [Sphingomonas sp. Leaf67]|nr:hypothetical protein ASE90_16700 [Sphingomonas sp. Leaf67]